MTTWILVADTSHAKLFSAERREEAWLELKNFEHPEGRESSQEISPSGPPAQANVARAGVAPILDGTTHVAQKEAEAERFAKHLATQLDEAVAKGELHAFVLVAPPHFLGMLHQTLAHETAKHLKATVDKDLVMFSAADIRERLLDVAFPPQ